MADTHPAVQVARPTLVGQLAFYAAADPAWRVRLLELVAEGRWVWVNHSDDIVILMEHSHPAP